MIILLLIRLFEKLSLIIKIEKYFQWMSTKVDLWNEIKDKLLHSGYSLTDTQQQWSCIACYILIRPEYYY